MLVGLAVLGAAGWGVGTSLGGRSVHAGGRPAGPGPARSTAPARAVPPLVAATLRLSAAQVQDFDPAPGDGHESPDQVAAVLDASPVTAWHTDRYRTAAFGGLKGGVGLVVDLGRSRPVAEVQLALTVAGASVELRTSNRPGGSAAAYRTVAAMPRAGLAVTLRPEGSVDRYLLVWFTALPPAGGGFQEGVSGLSLR